jgi:hypothetical protein
MSRGQGLARNVARGFSFVVLSVLYRFSWCLWVATDFSRSARLRGEVEMYRLPSNTTSSHLIYSVVEIWEVN